MRWLVQHVLAGGVDGIFVLGASGEGPRLCDREQAKAIETVVDEVAGKAAVFAGIMDTGTIRVIQRGRLAKEIGADLCVTTYPTFFLVDQQAIYQFYQRVSEDIGGQLLVYDVPHYFKSGGIEVATVARIAQLPGVLGVKDSQDFAHIYNCVLATKEDNFRVMAGEEYNLLAGLMVGCHGGVPSPANLVPSLCVDIYQTFKAGEIEKAQSLQDDLMRFSLSLEQCGPWIPTIKYALTLLGIGQEHLTQPFPSLDEEGKRLVESQMKAFGLLPV